MAKILITFFLLAYLSSSIVIAQEGDENIIDEIVNICKGGPDALTSWMKHNKERVNRDTIIEIAQYGIDKRLEGLIVVSLLIAREKNDPGILAEVYILAGFYLFKGNDFQPALEYYNKALPLLEESGDQKKLGNLYYLKGWAYYEIGDYKKVLDLGEKARRLYEKTGDLQMQSETDVLIALAYFNQGESLRALEILEKALQLNEKLKYTQGIAHVCWQMGTILLGIGQPERGLEVLEKARLLYGVEGYEIERAYIYADKGSCHFFSGEYDQALEMYEKALALFEKNQESQGKGTVYYKMGEIFMSRGNIIRALDMYERAEVSFKEANAASALCDVYRGKGYIYFMIGDFLRAMEMYDQSMYWYEKTGNLYGQEAINLAKAEIYLKNNDYKTALELYDKAISILDQIDSPWGKGWAYLGKAKIYLENNDFEKAEEMCEKALEISGKMEFPQVLANAYEGLGQIYYLKNEFTRSLKMYDKALAIYRELDDVKYLPCILIKKALSLVRQSRIDEAFMLIEESFVSLEKFRQQTAFSPMKRKLLEDFYPWYEVVVQWMMDFEYYERAFKYTEFIKGRNFTDQLSESLTKVEKGITPELLQKRDDIIATLSQLSKQISEAAQKKNEERLIDLRKEFLKAENTFDDLLLKIRLNNPLYASVQYPIPVSLDHLQNICLKTKEILIQYLITTKNVYVFLISKEGLQVVILGIKEEEINTIINRYFLCVNHKDTKKMIEYGWYLYRSVFKPIENALEGKTDIIIVPDGPLALLPFESFVMGEQSQGKPVYLLEKYRVKYIQSASALSFLRKYRQNERETNHFIGFGDPVYEQAGSRWPVDSEQLQLTPLGQRMKNWNDGMLEYWNVGMVPFGLFLYACGETLAVEPEKNWNGTRDTSTGHEIQEIHRGKYEREGGLFSRLPGSGQEVETIAGLFKSKNQKTTVYLREQANEEKAKAADMKEFDYIHFSCHGILGENFQSLVLSQIPDSKEDGYLTLNEIMNCDYNAKLVVLSACETGTGKMERAEGVTGLTRAVMYAGTPAVVASLWNVSDIGTKELMVRFYANMLEKGMSKEEALRQAKLEMIKDERYSSPYFWSAFVMYGE